MKRNLICTLIYILCVLPATAADQPRGAGDQNVRHVTTALDHLTVLEYDETVAMAAVGSPAFQIERQDNKVFIKPTKAGISTNLFVWTASNHRFGYELAVGDVGSMNASIHDVAPTPAPVADTAAKTEQIADALITRTLLGGRLIEGVDVRPSRTSRIKLRVEQVFPARNSIYIQYTLENLGARPYRIAAPSVLELELEHPHLNPVSVRGQQIDRKVLEELGSAKQIPLTIAHADNESNDVGPGMRQHGIVVVRRAEGRQSPIVLQLVFDTEVKATLVF